MIDNLTEEQLYQLGVIDEYLRYVGTSELESIATEAKTVAKLKNMQTLPSVVVSIVDHVTFQQNKISNLEADITQLRSHVGQLTDALHLIISSQTSTLQNADSKLTQIKNYHGIY